MINGIEKKNISVKELKKDGLPEDFTGQVLGEDAERIICM